MKYRIPVMIFLVAAVGFHLLQLWNLKEHFRFVSFMPPRWEPVKTGTIRPVHWDKSHDSFSLLKNTEIPYFDQKLKQYKLEMIQTNPLMSWPDRSTDNFGLDFWVRDSTRTDPGGDFFQIYRGGHDLRMGTSIFENYPQDMDPEMRKKLVDSAPFHPPNRYPPPFIMSAGFLLSLTGPWNAYLIWMALHEIALVYCVFLTWKVSGRLEIRLTASAMWLFFLPWYLELYMGQTTFIIMTAATVMMLWSCSEKSKVTAFLWWTAALITKPVPLLFTPVLIRMKRWKFALSGILLAIAGSIAYFIHAPQDTKVFAGWAFGQEMVSSLGNFCFQNLLFHLTFSELLTLLATVFWLILGLWLTFRTRPFDPVQLMAIWIAVYFLSYAHVWQHHLVLLLPACIVPFAVSGRIRFMIPWLLAAIPSPFYFFEGHWNWIRQVVYLLFGAVPPLVLLMMLLMTRLDKSNLPEMK